MLLRPRQRIFVDKTLEALRERRNTLAVAPTGAGKSVMLAALSEEVIAETKGKTITLAHRDELVGQNRARLRKYAGSKVSTGVFDANTKQTDRQATFAMVQTLTRNLEAIKVIKPAALLIDEAHHTPAPSYMRIIECAREVNPNLLIAGMTATPDRADSKTLRTVFDNIADQITIGELIRSGHLVRPRTFVVDLGTQKDLLKVRSTASDFDMKAVAEIMNKRPLLTKVYEEWKRLAGDRVTVFFTPDVATANSSAEVFAANGVKTAVVSQESADSERHALSKNLDSGAVQVVFNCAVLTEGFDNQLISCVGLLRPSSHKSTYIQMVGRGLRTVDPELYPGVTKADCMVLDFGTSTLLHGSLESDATLGREKPTTGDSPKKVCHSCESHVPLNAFECGICGYEFMIADPDAEGGFREKATLDNFVLTEVEIFQDSPYRWEELWDGIVIVATAFDAWAICILYKGEWHAIGGDKEKGLSLLAKGEKVICIAKADDFLREHGDSDGAKKSKRWLKEPATLKQLQYLRVSPMEAIGITRYKAACLLSWMFNERGIKVKLNQSAMTKQAA